MKAHTVTNKTTGCIAAFVVVLFSSCSEFSPSIKTADASRDEWKHLQEQQRKESKKNQDEELVQNFLRREVSFKQIERNLTLADDPDFGKLYRLDSFHLEINFPKNEIEKFKIGRKDFRSADTLVIFVQLERLADGPAFNFDDYQAGGDGKIYEAICASQWFRVITPDGGNGKHIIRGFNRSGRCIYYREWVKSQAIPDPKSSEYDVAIDGHRKGLPEGVTIPKMRLPAEQ